VSKQLAIVALALALIALGVWALATRTSQDNADSPVSTESTQSRSVTPTPPVRAPAPSREQAANRLRVLQQESATLMPDDVRGVFIGLRGSELTTLRPSAHQSRGAPDGHTLYQESLSNSVVVAYLLSARLDRVAQVQFLARIRDPQQLLARFRSLRAKYGPPTGLFDCPRSLESAPTRRILWVGREVTVMEAILVQATEFSLTLAIAGNMEVGRSLQRQQCTPVTERTLADWPIATELRGERVPIQP
jgi:hypothetical protein